MQFVFENLGAFGTGLLVTILLAIVGYVGAFVIGLVMATLRISPVPTLRAVGTAYVDVVRNVPLPVQFVVVFFVFPSIGITLSPLVASFTVLAVYHGAFATEIIRSGVNTVERGQVEAARSLGMPFGMTMSVVVLPIALRSMVPPLGSLFIALTKNTSVAYTISLVELTGTADRLAVENAQPVPVFLAAAFLYLLLTVPSGLALRVIERRVAVLR